MVPEATSHLGSGFDPPPIIQAFRYQREWVDDSSRLKIITKTRQAGITFWETWDIVTYLLSVPNQTWYYLSVSEDRAVDAIDYAATHCAVMGALIASMTDSVEWFGEDGDRVKYRQLTIAFPNGSKLVGLPANARTARGCVGHITLDEFAHHLDADKIWTAVSPIITWGFRLHVISTPNGMQGRFYRIWTGNERLSPEVIEECASKESKDLRLYWLKKHGLEDRWSRHFVDIHRAKADGHPVDIDEQREIAGDELTWLQEYCGKFLDEGLAVLPYELLKKGYDDRATFALDFDNVRQYGPLFGGYDVARKRDLAVLWVNERLKTGQFLQRACVTLKQSEFSTQEQVLSDHMPYLRRICIDATGMGEQLAENMQKRFGEVRVEAVSLNGGRPASLVSKIRKLYEATPSRQLTAEDAQIRRDFHSVHRTHTEMGNVRYSAPRGKDGHADRFWAASLALEAADQDPGSFKDARSVGPRRMRSGSLRSRYGGNY